MTADSTTVTHYTTGKSGRLAWDCEVCGKPIADDAGSLTVNMSEVERVGRAWKAHDADQARKLEEFKRINGHSWMALNLHDMLVLPKRVPWRALHFACDPRMDQSGYDYWIGVERARSAAHLLHWTAHMMGKRWLQYTGWANLVGHPRRDATTATPTDWPSRGGLHDHY